LADDVLAVLDSLKIPKPVLVGHSMAGSEMTTLGVQHSDRLAGLVYLDAGDDPGNFSGKNPAYQALFKKLTTMTPPPASEGDKKSFQAFRERQMRIMGFAFPESEWRNNLSANVDGSVGPTTTSNSVRKAINDGSKKRDYSGIAIPVLAFFAVDAMKDGWSQYYHFRPRNAEERAALEDIFAADRSYLNQYEDLMRSGVPSAHIVELTGADHYVFLSNEADVLREIRAFLAGLR
jgi:pimeloyl-ACP methyl ester carboxylesterase